MTQSSEIKSSNGSPEELTLSGMAVSRGLSVGTVLCLHGRKRQFYRREIAGSDVAREADRFREAVEAAKAQLTDISNDAAESQMNRVKIFETHRLFLEDRSLLSQIESMIGDQRVNAEWAVKSVIDKYVSRYKSLSDKHLQEKYIDLEDVGERLLSALGSEEQSYSLAKDTIIVARELNPSTLIELSKKKPLAVVTENGGWTSHTFILARELELPAVTGIRQLLRMVESGDRMVVDGYHGTVILRPADETESKVREAIELAESELADLEITEAPNRLETLDGIPVIIRANLDISRDYSAAVSLGAKGIGLYRSEFLFNRNRGFPSEEEQVEIYTQIAAEANSAGIRIRTFDLSIGQIAGGAGREKNPALGLRGIRFSFRLEPEFRKQIRALLRAAAEGNLSIVLPMIADAEDVRWAKHLIDEEKAALERDSLRHGDPPVGVMIEVPSAVFTIDRILEISDFLNIGTNDLVQYLLAVDRDNEEVADWFRTSHSSVLESLRIVIAAAERAGKSTLICGEMAGSPLYIPILLGLGAREFSMNVNSIRRVRRLVSKIAVEECRAVLAEIEELPDGPDRDKGIHRIYKNKWSDLMDFDNLLTFVRS